MTEQEQVDALYAVQGYDHDLEAQLHEARVLSVRPFDAARVHVSTTYELVLDSGHLCIFKPADGLLEAAADGLFHGKQALAQYEHTPLSTTISECAAWQLAKQLGPKGIRVNGVAPGPIWTPLQVSGGAQQGKLVTFGATAPLGRPGQPAELAGIYVRLAEDDGSYTTGNIYGAGGGQGQP